MDNPSLWRRDKIRFALFISSFCVKLGLTGVGIEDYNETISLRGKVCFIDIPQAGQSRRYPIRIASGFAISMGRNNS